MELVNKAAMTSATDKKGSVPLHYAAEKGHLEITKFLVDSGVNIDASR